jgi:hypothetical protein
MLITTFLFMKFTTDSVTIRCEYGTFNNLNDCQVLPTPVVSLAKNQKQFPLMMWPSSDVAQDAS